MPREVENMMTIHDLQLNESLLLQVSSLHQTCFNICDKLDCHSVRYIPRFESLSFVEHSATLDKQAFSLEPPIDPTVTTVCQASMPLVTFLTALFSTFGF